jgi:hypothetical protein
MDDRRSRLAASVLAMLGAGSVWLSAGVVLCGDATRIAALPSYWFIVVVAAASAAVAWITRLQLEHAWPLGISLVLWLPYLPIPIPPSFLMWDGPIEGMVWLVVVAGLIAAKPPFVPRLLSNPAVAPWLAAVVVATSALGAFSQVRNVIPGGDEPHYLAVTQSLIHDADLRVANNYENGEYLEYFPGRLEPHFLRRSTAGEVYSIHAPGVSVIVLPAFAVAGYVGAVLTMVLFAAGTAALAWRLAFRLSGSAAGAWMGVAGVMFSAPYFFHAFTIYPEIIGGFCVLAGVWLLVELSSGAPSTRALLVVGALLAVLPWLHSRFAVLAGIIGILATARLARQAAAIRRIPAFLLLPAASAGAWFAFFYLIWGTPSPAAPYGPDTSISAAYILRGLIGLLFDQQFGLLPTAPIYAIAAIGGIALYRAQRRLAIELALIVIPYAITVGSFAMWWAGAAAPARFLVAILPLAGLPLAMAWARWPALRTIGVLLAIVSTALIVPRVWEDYGRFIYSNRSGVDATLQWLTPSVDLPRALPSVHRTGGSAAARDGAIWLAGLALTTAVAGWGVRHWKAGARIAATALTLIFAVMACARLAWAVDGEGPLAPNPELAMLGRFRTPFHGTILELPSGQRKTVEALLSQLTVKTYGSETTLNRVPAGEYIVQAAPPGPAGGTLEIYLGRNDRPIAQPTLDDLRNPGSPFTLRLPVTARNLSFRVDPGSSNRPTGLTLVPAAVVCPPSRHAAIRAGRFGSARAFFFDEWAYPEQDGFWTRANGSAYVAIDTDEAARRSGLPISIAAGAVATTVRLSMENWEQSFSLSAGQKQEVMVPPAAGRTWLLHIRSGAGFRPSEREPGSRDVRNLAAWITVH